MKNTLTWRLSKLPTVLELQELVKDKIITQEEARGILFNEQTAEEVRDGVSVESLKSEIEFLRKMVDKLANGNYSRVTEYIYTYPKHNYNWYEPYKLWCGTSLAGSQDLANYTVTSSSANNALYMDVAGPATEMSSITTF